MPGDSPLDVASNLISLAQSHSKLDARVVAQAKLVLCDLDGCLIAEGRAFADTADFVAGCGARLWIVSNASDTTAADMSLRLANLGIHVPAERILLAGEIMLDYVANVEQIRHMRLFAPAALIESAKALGVDPAAEVPQAVLLCRDPAVTVDTLGQILALVGQGAPLWVANEDLSHPGHDTQPVAETGALLAALRAIRPALVWRSLGKPDPTMLTMALARSGLGAADAIFVGDNALTDGRAAAALGMSFIHIQRSISR
jgi:4-nitrophenyl phosphatase